MYRASGSNWLLDEEIVGVGRLGSSVDIDGDQLAGGAALDSGGGAIYTFDIVIDEDTALELVQRTRETLERVDMQEGKRRELIRRLRPAERQLERNTRQGHGAARQIVRGMIRDVAESPERLIREDSKKKIKDDLERLATKVEEELELLSD